MIWRALAVALSTLSLSCAAPEPRVPTWTLVTEGVWRSPGTPAAYALADGDGALLFGAPLGADPSELAHAGITKIEGAYLTHHHRDSAAGATAYAAAGIPLRAPRASEPWLSPEGVQRFWRGYFPPAVPPETADPRDRVLKSWDYLVLPEGLPTVEYSVEPERAFDWRGWTITPVATPGHSRGHTAYAARRKGAESSKPLVFCGDALSEPGKLWTPYTSDWAPSGDEGLAAAAASLRKLLALDPAALFPEHGPAILDAPGAALARTAEAAAEAAFLKSYERYTKERVGNAPAVRLLDRTQLGSDGRRPWSRLTDNLIFTGSTYAVMGSRGGIWIVDPAGVDLAAQVVRAQKQRFVGNVELVTITRPHADLYGAVTRIASPSGPPVWGLDTVSNVLTAPAYRRTPNAHPLPVPVARTLSDGERAGWKNFELEFRRLPGHGASGSAIFCRIDGKRVVFSGDAFLHPEHDGGAGGWSGLIGGMPSELAAGARVILEAKPDWILAARGGPFEFVAADWERRVAWANAAATACDRLSPSGDHRFDWNPGLVRVEPFIRPVSLEGQRQVSVDVVVSNPLDRPQNVRVELAGRGVVEPVERELQVPPLAEARAVLPLRIADGAYPGLHVFPLRVLAGDAVRHDDAVFALELR